MTGPVLDPTTILFAASCVALTLGGGLLILRPAFAQFLRGLTALAGSSAILGLGCAFFVAGRSGVASSQIAGACGAFGVYASAVLFHMAVCSLLDRNPRLRFAVAVMTPFWLCGVWLLYEVEVRDRGIAVLCSGVILAVVLTMRETWISVRARQRGATLLLAVQGLLVVTLAILVAVVLVRSEPEIDRQLLLWITPFVYLAGTIMVIVAMLQGLLIVNERAIRRLRQASLSEDLLTGLANRNALFDVAERELERCEGGHKALSLVLIELDNIRQYNDWYGHTLGDAILVHVANCIRARIRPGERAGRWGGSSFAVLMPESPGGRPSKFANLLTESLVLDPMRFGTLEIEISICSGFATSEVGGSTRDALVAAAEESLHEAMSTATGVGRPRTIE